MIIQCPACHARARISDSQEGAKVRCGECGRIFVAGGGGGRKGSASGNKLGLWLGLGAGGAAVLFALVMVSKGKGTDYQSRAQETTEETLPKLEEESGFTFEDSHEIRAAVRVHEDAWHGNLASVQLALHGPSVYAWKKGLARKAELEAEGATEVTIPPEDVIGWEAEFAVLPLFEREKLVNEYAKGICEGDDRALVAEWRPYDGEIVHQDEEARTATVRLQVATREKGSAESRTVQWTLKKEKGNWKACSWERWYSEAEKRANRRRRGRGYEKRTLSDGSVVLEREPEPLGHLEDTPPELRERIDRLIATMIDLDLTTEARRAQTELVEIARPAIPRLLTKLFEIPLDNEDHSIQIMLVVGALRDITGQYFGYKPQEFLGSGTGTTKERRESAIKQWFAWWYRNQRKFVEKEVGPDGLEELVTPDEKEKRWLETHDG